VTTRQQRERAFHNVAFAGDVREPAQRFWVANQGLDERYTSTVFAEGAGRDVLEYGCGQGGIAVRLADRAAHVTGIDISDVAVEQARGRASASGVAERATFTTMDAENLSFDDASFDLVCGNGILHHLDVDRALGQIARVLRPGGLAVFSEPLGHNPLINLYRRRTPEMRTIDEHPLLLRDIELARRHFESVTVDYFTLFTLAAVPLHGRRTFVPVLHTLERLDRKLFDAVPYARRHAWMSLLVMRGR
jgi:ubiquinone/menaquinone biosynthesis C-methylase UbiE